VSEQTDPSPDEDGERRISVRRLVPIPGTTTGEIIRAVRAASGRRPVRAISVAVVDRATIASLHERYLGDPRATDVLAFDLRDDADDDWTEGEIVVSADAARQQGERLGVDAGRELLRYVIHGMLHLSGYDDQTPAGRRRMRNAENRLLADLNERCGRRTRKRPLVRPGRAKRGA